MNVTLECFVAMVLQRSCDDFSSARRTAIDQYDQRFAVYQIARTSIKARYTLRAVTAGRDNLSLIEEGIGYIDGLIEQTPGFETLIKDETLKFAVRNFALDILDTLLRLIECLFGEGKDVEISDIVLNVLLDGINLDPHHA